mmetsp:Transcript_98684/g.318211  ORF Transcript_98684/g.318211 Transcript_98684/m.318211 type:complete len:386 (+) Transcript_98684:43-1200(+)
MLPSADVWSASSGNRKLLQKSLAGRGTHELLELVSHLSRDRQHLEDMLWDLKAQQGRLMEDNAGLRQTIELVIGHLTLSTAARNATEPKLAGGPLDVLGRFWERVRPRDSTILVNDHIGEIKKLSVVRESAGRTLQPVAGQMAAASGLATFGRSVTERLTGALGLPLYKVSDTEALLGAAATGAPAQAAKQLDVEARMDVADGCRGDRAKPQGQRALFQAILGLLGVSLGECREEKPAQPSPQPSPRHLRCVSTARTSTSPSRPRPPVVEAVPLAAVKGGPSAPGLPGRVMEEPEQTEVTSLASSVLIEVSLALDGVELATCQVRSTDRCRQVAERFVEEHSLKPCFKTPLTAFLMKAEADAVKFPVVLQADLMDIQMQSSAGVF